LKDAYAPAFLHVKVREESRGDGEVSSPETAPARAPNKKERICSKKFFTATVRKNSKKKRRPQKGKITDTDSAHKGGLGGKGPVPNLALEKPVG